MGAKRQAQRRVSPSEGNEARRERRRTSEHPIVPAKRGNGSRPDLAEGRGCHVTDLLEGNMPGASKPDPVSTKQQRIAELAQQAPARGFTSLAYHIDLRWLYEAYLRVRPDAAAGVDG